LPVWAQEYQLYEPHSVAAGQKNPAQEGILVQEILVQKGDTLYGLSRKFNGRGMYFPQILLFNDIKNPNLIYYGNTLKIPIRQIETTVSEQADATLSPMSHKKETDGGNVAGSNMETKPVPHRTNEIEPLSRPVSELSLGNLKNVGKAKSSSRRNGKKSTAYLKKPQTTHSSNSASDIATASVPLAGSKKGVAVRPEANVADGQKLFEKAVNAYRRDDCAIALGLFDRYLADYSGSALAADANLYKAECYLKLSAK